MNEIRIYVACLAAYNNGILHGQWIDAAQGIDGIWEDVKSILKSSPIEGAEEWAIHDYEGFGSYKVSEYEGLDSVSEIAEFIEERGEIGAELLAYYSDINEAKKAFDEQHAGSYTSVADFAQDLTEQTGEIPKHLEFYIDYERMGRDMELSGDIFTIEIENGEVHIFWNH